MGRIRKTLSVCTLGIIKFRNAKELTAARTKKANKLAREQNRILREQGKS